MKICNTEKEYIEAIAPAVQKACKRYGYLPSVLIAQSCLENGYGIRSYWDNPQIEALLAANNMVGIKSSLLNDSWNDYTVWQGESITKRTPEEYNGKMVTITDDFRKYDNIERSFCDFLLFLKYASNYGKGGVPKYGDAVLAIKDPEKLIKTVSGRGYATGSTYPTSVMRILNKHNLTKYDYLDNVEPSDIIPNSLKHQYTTTKTETSKASETPKASEPTIIINRQYLTTNNTNSTNDPQYIVIHNTDNYAKGANAYAHAEGLYHGYMTGMSWHYVTDDHSIYQCVPHNRGAWHVGKNFGSNNLFGVINNRNSIGIEMCVNAGYDYEKAFQNTVALTKYLMKELNIPASKVYQHYDVCTKNCPSEIRKRGDWARFKKLIGDTSVTVASTSTASTSTSTLLRKGSTGTAVKTMQTMLIACGYSCGNSGADGDFGSNTEKALMAFQGDHKLGVDGIYGPASKAALESAYKATQTNTEQAEIWINEVAKVAETARKQKWTYGNSTSDVPCADKKISCDRLVARALHNLGCASQPKGGVTCGNIGTYLPKFGFTKVTKKSEIKPGAVVAVRKIGTKNINHVFVVKSYNASNDTCVKYDTGSQSRIDTAQPFKNVKLVEWNDREFVCAWNVPKKLTTSSSTPKQTVKFTLNGLDYSPVFNPVYYSNKYADLFKAFGTDAAKLWDHFKTYGMKEARQASSNFNVEKYKANYQDLQKAFGNNWPLYYKHYIEFGKKEGRKA